MYVPDARWLLQTQERAIEPDQRICDAHHHYWDRPLAAGRFCYLFHDFLDDRQSSGHSERASISVEAGARMRAGLDAGAMYRSSGSTELASLGETEFLNGQSAMAASGSYGASGIGAWIVAYVYLRSGRRAGGPLDRQSKTWMHP